MDEEPRGLYPKYAIAKSDGSPIDPNAQYFVLRLDTDPAARISALAYAHAIEETMPELASDIRDWVSDIIKAAQP